MQPSPQRLKLGGELLKMLPALSQSSGPLRRKKNICSSSESGMTKDVMTLVGDALRKPSIDRSVFDKELIVKLLEGIDPVADVLDRLTNEAMLSLSDGCHLHEYEPMQIVCRYGDASDAVYYVLQGEIAVTSLIQSKYHPDQLDKSNLLNRVKPRMLFGEAGVLSKAGRTANCVCLEKTTLVVIDARYYADSVGKEVMINRQKKVGFLSKVQLFDSWDYPKLVAFYESIIRKRISPPYGTYLVKPGRCENKIFIIFKGQVEIGTFDESNKEDPNEQPIGSRLIFLKKDAGRGKFRPLMLLEANSFFGDENNRQTNPKQQLAAKVVSYDCQLYFIERNLLMMNTFKMELESKLLEARLADRNKQLLRLSKESRKAKTDIKKKGTIKDGFKGWEELIPTLASEGDQVENKTDNKIRNFVVTHSRISPTKYGRKKMTTTQENLDKESDTNLRKSSSDCLKELLWFDDGSTSKRLRGFRQQTIKTKRSKSNDSNNHEPACSTLENVSLTKGANFLDFCKKKLALKKASVDSLSRRIQLSKPDFFITHRERHDRTCQSLRLKSTGQLKPAQFLQDGYSSMRSESMMKITQAGSRVEMSSVLNQDWSTTSPLNKLHGYYRSHESLTRAK